MNNQFTTFSVLLGLTDFLNPIFMTLTFVTLMKGIKESCDKSMYLIFKIGALIALVGGYFIPTGKVIVGLGLIDFVMPVPVVHLVNTGFLISGVTLFLICRNKTYKSLPVWEIVVITAGYIGAFVAICCISKYNTAAVLTGVVGIFLIYISVIILSVSRKKVLPIILVVFSVGLTLFLSVVGSTWNVYSSPFVHWVIEITNAVCQCILFISTRIIFVNKIEIRSSSDTF